MTAHLEKATESPSGVRATIQLTFVAEGINKPVCVAQFVLYLGKPAER